MRRVDWIRLVEFDMTEIERAWLGGLVEGEGSMRTYTDKRDGSAVWMFYLGMTDEDVIARAADLMGVEYSTRPRSDPKYKPLYEIRINHMDWVYSICEWLLPYFGERRSMEALNIMYLREQYTTRRQATRERPFCEVGDCLHLAWSRSRCNSHQEA